MERGVGLSPGRHVAWFNLNKKMKTKKSTNPDSTNHAPGNRQTDASLNHRLIGKRFPLAVALMVASLTLFVWGAGGISYGDPTRSTSLKVTASPQFYPTFGTPNDALITPDNAYVLVSVGGVHPCSNEGCAGVQVFTQPGFTNPCGGQQILGFPLPIPGSTPPPPGGPVTAVDGLKFFPGQSHLSVGAAVEAQGAEFFRLASLNEPCAVDGIINVQQPPVIPNCNPQNLCPPGTFNVAVTPDGQYAFVANEYGTLPSPTPPDIDIGSGTVGIIQTHRDDMGRFTPRTRRIPGTKYIYVPGGGAIAGVTMSHDGKYVYVTSEVVGTDDINPHTMMPYRDPTNVANSPSGIVLCPGCPDSNGCDGKSAGTDSNNGLLTVIDVNKAKRGMGQASIVTVIASGCSPVRAVETADGRYVFVATRGKNTLLPLPLEPGATGYQVLAFDRATLVSHSPNNALVGYGDTHGTGPVGIALFGPQDGLLAVANGNRYYREPGNRRVISPDCRNRRLPPCTANVAIMDVSDPTMPIVQQTVPAYSISSFPRDVTVGPDGSTLYVPNADAKMLEVIATSLK
jgi:hypothetical protein